MPYYKLRHTNGVVMWFRHGRPDLEPAEKDTPDVPTAISKIKPKPKPRPKAKAKAKLGAQPKDA